MAGPAQVEVSVVPLIFRGLVGKIPAKVTHHLVEVENCGGYQTVLRNGKRGGVGAAWNRCRRTHLAMMDGSVREDQHPL